MLRLFTDFNAITPDDECWILVHDGSDVTPDLVKPGDRVLLYQDADDFEVEATIDERFVAILQRRALVALPDWDTMREITA